LTKKENNKNELVQTHTPKKSTAGETSLASTSDQSRGRQDAREGQGHGAYGKNQKEKIKH
jgi:hypothetical protein